MSLTFPQANGDSPGDTKSFCPSEEDIVRACRKSRPAFQPQALSAFERTFVRRNTAAVLYVYESAVTDARIFACSMQTTSR
ncbi:hypothetical protein EFR84_03260 [Rhizobium chutanense]|uniref:Uncharacterized protein n=1 Tax=Rhizobium chutanense TaxID=2035448 RepID=A0A3S0SKP6_9HYPH|nr:hypothetical protein EFR84_03260 [Rhizobium chutanense]